MFAFKTAVHPAGCLACCQLTPGRCLGPGLPAQSPDAETAGAAFVVLMALLGDGSVPSPGAGAGGWPPDVDTQLAGLTLDAHYGLPAALATAGAAAQARQTPCRLACVPTDAQLLQALQESGFHPGGPPAGSPAGGRAPRQQQQQASGPAGGGQRQGQQEQEEPALVLRLQTVKLVLHSAAAVCRYCRRVSSFGRGGALATSLLRCLRSLLPEGPVYLPGALLPDVVACCPSCAPGILVSPLSGGIPRNAHAPCPVAPLRAAPGSGGGGALQGRRVGAAAGGAAAGAGPFGQPAAGATGCR